VVADLERRVNELRFVEGIEKVEHVPYETGDQFWVRFNRPLDLRKLDEVVRKHGYVMLKFGTIPSKLPRGLGELLSNGVTHIITKRISGWSKFTSSLGFEPEGIAKLAVDLHGPYQIFMAAEEEGIQLLYEYLGLRYVPPAASPPLPKSAIPAKPTASPVTRPSQPTAPQPAPAAKPPATGSSVSAQIQQPTRVAPAVQQAAGVLSGQTAQERTQTKKETPSKETT
jgi:hypothetical protein